MRDFHGGHARRRQATYALQVATELLDRGLIREVTVVAPTEHLKHQWADAAARVGIHLNPAFANSVAVQSHEYGGVALTYAQVASRPDLHRQRTLARPTLVILDEIHHGGDAKSWGDAIREAFEPATRRLSLTGTPFRSDTSPIPFVRYEMDEQGILLGSRPLVWVCRGLAGRGRPAGALPRLRRRVQWRTKAGDEVAARLGEPMTKDAARDWRTALDPREWIPSVLRAADKRLTEVRRHVPDAGAMVIASNQTAARAYARHLETITGEKPTVVLSDDSGASTRIEEYAAGTSRWLVAVRMVSEGVDVPRLCVGVYATSTSTPLFFAQAVGRFVRARKRGETASVFLPSVPIILELAATMEAQRDHALDRPSSDESEASLWAEEEGLIAAANRTERTLGIDEPSFEALESEAHFDHVLFDKQQFGLHAAVGSQEEQDYLGLPGLLEPDQVATLLNERQAKQSRQTKGSTRPTNPAPVSAHRALAAQRKELNSLVAAYAKKTGAPHANVHMELRRACGGPELAQASSEQVTERIDRIRRWFVGRR